MPKKLDGASVSLERQIDMLRFIKSHEKGVKLNQVQFYMTMRHGMTKGWVLDKVKNFSGWGVIQHHSTKLTISDDKWKEVMKLRSSTFGILEDD